MRKTLLVSLVLAFFFGGSAALSAPSGVTVSPASLSFGTVTENAKSPALTVVVTNSAGHTVPIYRIYSSSPGFVVLSPSTPLQLVAGGKTSFQVIFAPNALHSFSGSVLVVMGQSTGGSTTLSVPVSGSTKSPTTTGSPSGANPPPTGTLTASATSVAFGSELVGSSTAKTVSLTNSGKGNLILSQATVSGTGFTVSGLSSSTSVAAGGSLKLTVTFKPTAMGAVTGSLHIVGNSALSSATIALSGAGVESKISVIPSSISFPKVSVGVTNTQSVTIKNMGNANLTISKATIAGSSFTMSGMATPMSIAPGGSSTLTVGFKPTTASTYYANLTIMNNSPTSPQVTVPLSGSSTSPVLQLSASPAALSFGSVTDGTSSTKTVTLSNTGNSSVTISSIGITGTGFKPTTISLPLTLAAGQTASFGVLFTPTTAATLTGTATVVSSAANSPLAVALTGTGSSAATHSVDLSWTPSSTSFAGFNIYRGTTSGGPYSRVNSGLLTAADYTDTAVAAGSTYYYVATEESTTGVESGYSSQVSATIP